jgi:hypothetical protein
MRRQAPSTLGDPQEMGADRPSAATGNENAKGRKEEA